MNFAISGSHAQEFVQEFLKKPKEYKLVKEEKKQYNERNDIIKSHKTFLKEQNINQILNDFFGEILISLNTVKSNFQKSDDEKNSLTEIKNITGNSLSDVQLKKLVSNSKDKFIEEMVNLFFEKQKSRVQILGEEQNCSLEKKVFLQIIDFSWRSHLQYLEQLRQVIGLRQYGQKDPL